MISGSFHFLLLAYLSSRHPSSDMAWVHASALLAPIQAAGGANGGNILTDWAAGVATPPLVGTRLVRDLPANPLDVFTVLAPVQATSDDWVSTLPGAHFTTPLSTRRHWRHGPAICDG